MEIIRFDLTGQAYRLLREGSPGERVEQALSEATLTRVGRGRRARFAVEREVAHEIADYLWGVAGVVGEMTAAEREGGNEATVAREALRRVEAALNA